MRRTIGTPKLQSGDMMRGYVMALDVLRKYSPADCRADILRFSTITQRRRYGRMRRLDGDLNRVAWS